MDPRIDKLIATLTIITWTLRIYGIIEYNCGSASANLITLSIINIEKYDIPLQTVNASKVYIQLLQLNEFKSVKVTQCKVEIDRTVKKCGMFSHTMDIHIEKSYIEEGLSRSMSMHACLWKFRNSKNSRNGDNAQSNRHSFFG